MIQPSLNTRGWLQGPWLSFHGRHQLTGPHNFLDPEFWSLFPPRFGWKSGTSRYLKFSLLPMVFHHVSHEHCHLFGTSPFGSFWNKSICWCLPGKLTLVAFWLSSMIFPFLYVEESGWLDQSDPIFLLPSFDHLAASWARPAGVRGRGEPCRLRRCWRIWMRPRTDGHHGSTNKGYYSYVVIST